MQSENHSEILFKRFSGELQHFFFSLEILNTFICFSSKFINNSDTYEYEPCLSETLSYSTAVIIQSEMTHRCAARKKNKLNDEFIVFSHTHTENNIEI